MHWKPIANLYRISQNRLAVLGDIISNACILIYCMYLVSFVYFVIWIFLFSFFFFRCDEIVQGEI